MKKLEIEKTKPTFIISVLKVDILKVGLVFSISSFFITKTPLANNWRRKKIPSCSNSALGDLVLGVWKVLGFSLSALWIIDTKIEYLPLCIHAGLLLILSNHASRFSAIRLHLWPGHLPLWISCNSFFELNFFHTPWILPSGLWNFHKWHCCSLMTFSHQQTGLKT